MPIGFRAAGAEVDSTTDPASPPGMPGGFGAGDMLVLVVTSKAATPPTCDTPADWTAPADNTVTGGAGTAGASTGGPNRCTVFTKVAVGGDAAPTINLSAAASPTMAAVFAFSKAPAEVWSPVVCANSSDTSGSTSAYNPAEAGVTIPLGAGDWIGVADAINDEAGTTTVPATLTVAGVTLDTVSNLIDSPTTTGNDSRMIVDVAPVLSGAASAGPDRAVSIASAIANMAGCSVFFRLRVSVPTVNVDGTLAVTAGTAAAVVAPVLGDGDIATYLAVDAEVAVELYDIQWYGAQVFATDADADRWYERVIDFIQATRGTGAHPDPEFGTGATRLDTTVDEINGPALFWSFRISDDLINEAGILGQLIANAAVSGRTGTAQLPPVT